MLDDILQQQYFVQMERGELTDKQMTDAQNMLESLSQVRADYQDERSNIIGNADLSAEGKTKALFSLSEQTFERIERVSNLAPLERKIAETRQLLRPQKESKDDVLEFLKQQAIRDMLANEDELKIMGIYTALAESGEDDLTMRAIENAPTFRPLITDKSTIEKGMAARGYRQSPEAAQQLKQLEAMHDALLSAKDHFRAELGLPKDDPIARIARGEIDPTSKEADKQQSSLSDADKERLMAHAKRAAARKEEAA